MPGRTLLCEWIHPTHSVVRWLCSSRPVQSAMQPGRSGTLAAQAQGLQAALLALPESLPSQAHHTILHGMKVILCAVLFTLPCSAGEPFSEPAPASRNPDVATVRVELERFDLPLSEIAGLVAVVHSSASADPHEAVRKCAQPSGLTSLDLEEGTEQTNKSETEIQIPTSWTVKPDQAGVPRIHQDGTERRGLETSETGTASVLPGGREVRLQLSTTRRECPGRQRWKEGDSSVDFPVLTAWITSSEAILPAGQWTVWSIERLPSEGSRNDEEFPSEKRRITFVRALLSDGPAPDKPGAPPAPPPHATLICEWIHTDADTVAALMEKHSPLAGKELRAGAEDAVKSGKADLGEICAVQLLSGAMFSVSASADYSFPGKVNRTNTDSPVEFSDLDTGLKLEGSATHDAAADTWSLRIGASRIELQGSIPGEIGQPAESLSAHFPRTRRMIYDGEVALPSGQTRLAAVVPVMESGQPAAGKVALIFLTVVP